MADVTIRTANVAVLLKLQTAEGSPATPDPAVDALPVEADSITYTSPWTTEASNEATGSLVASAPLVIGQPATVGFRSRIKGAGVGETYSPTVKPPLHQMLASAGWKPLFTAAIAAAVATAGSATTATLAATFPNTARSLLGMVLEVAAGAGSGQRPAVTEYTAGRVATLTDGFAPPLDTTSSIALPANWTYAASSPGDAAARATDQPAATIWIYEDGTLHKFVDCRGVVTIEAQTARPGFAGATFTGIYAGKTDAALPANLTVAGHQAPVLAQGATGIAPSVLLNRKPLPISRLTLDAGGNVESVEDPNTSYGFGAGQIAGRAPQLRLDPLATLVATRDLITDIGLGTTMTAVARFGSVAGNRWALTVPLAQPIESAPGTRGTFRSEEVTLQARTSGRDAQGRDTDRILCFY